MITISVLKINGDLQEFTEEDSIITRLTSLRNDGYAGKELIHKLLTDDWGTPPVGVRLRGVLEDVTRIDEYIPYK